MAALAKDKQDIPPYTNHYAPPQKQKAQKKKKKKPMVHSENSQRIWKYDSQETVYKWISGMSLKGGHAHRERNGSQSHTEMPSLSRMSLRISL